MPSRSNPNVPNKSRRVASRAKVQSRNAKNKITKNPTGTRRSNVLHPTGGPLAPVSKKKARKLEKAQNNARKRAIERAMEQEGEVQMTGELCRIWTPGILSLYPTDAPKTTKSKKEKAGGTDEMDMDVIS
ncbi:hypothetical protein BJ875DRAFT_207157 [Amylocarpus encephaloides]|uniref:Ribosome biogenesis protein ALB1 n=1 Tax=Amylocarpus encephaloides TaxID=45428 RepID=A0A9P7YNG1_9HELO|nr:hypothetical protein BJ875DRAFT_207157 [Amylocarpus encephaloides]